ncbi:elicitor-responsive protein 3-like isoform X1 [Euphorbia lathyris]|uniref:elicitor-responsive protein 3-like isoform X1 n=1 Tax=Euphorbia lathyris TaxID=212925 RepID=UPI003313FFDE
MHGTLEVLLCGAKGLENTDLVKNMDAYVVLCCRSQEQKSSVASGQGSEPEWNENFIFTISDSATNLVLKILDSDVGTADDFVGEATIPLEAVFQERSIPPAVYNVVKDEKYKGEIKLALTFKPEQHGSHGHQEEEMGGWKDSSADY